MKLYKIAWKLLIKIPSHHLFKDQICHFRQEILIVEITQWKLSANLLFPFKLKTIYCWFEKFVYRFMIIQSNCVWIWICFHLHLDLNSNGFINSYKNIIKALSSITIRIQGRILESKESLELRHRHGKKAFILNVI